MLLDYPKYQPRANLLASTQGHSEPERTVYPKHLDEKSGADYDYQDRERKQDSFLHPYHPSHYKFTFRRGRFQLVIQPAGTMRQKVQVGIPVVWFYNFLKLSFWVFTRRRIRSRNLLHHGVLEMKYLPKIIGLLLVFSLLAAGFSTTVRAQEDLSPIVPAIASFVIPGSGQLVNDQPNKALTHFVVGVGVSSIYYLPFTYTPIWRVLPALQLAWHGYSSYDAYQVATGRRGSIFDTELELENPTNYSEERMASSPELSGSELEFSVSSLKSLRNNSLN